MYKRRARLLFVHPNPEKAREAVRTAVRLGQDWLESRDASQEAPVSEEDAQQHWHWADLVIYLEGAPRHPLPMAQHAQLRCWHLPEDENWPAVLSHKIQGVIGGLRMLARLDGGCTPMLGKQANEADKKMPGDWPGIS